MIRRNYQQQLPLHQTTWSTRRVRSLRSKRRVATHSIVHLRSPRARDRGLLWGRWLLPGGSLLTLRNNLFAYLSPALIACPCDFLTYAKVSSRKADLLDTYWSLL